MITALAYLVLQSQDAGPIVLPPGSSHEFQSMVYAVQAAVNEGDWAEAGRLAGRLPSLDVTVSWDEKGLTDNQKLFFAGARDIAVKAWKQIVPELNVTFVPQGKLKIGFTQTLPPNSESLGPAGAVYLYSPETGEPVVEGVIALLRGAEKRPVEAMDVRNETAYAIGAYLGLARQVRIGHIMYRSEDPYVIDNTVAMGDGRLALKNIELADRIRKDIAARRDPKVAAPQIKIDPVTFDPKPVSQGDEMGLTLQVTNTGQGTLDYRLVPDCGCFVLGVYKEQLAPGESTVVQILINTFDFTGKLSKALYVYSNDPDFPIKRIPLQTTVRPAYRFVDLIKEPVVIVDADGTKFETVLIPDEGKGFKILRATVNGVRAVVEVDDTPWEGTLDYPELGEGPKKRKGYLIRALISPNLPPGRQSMEIQLTTDNKTFETIRHGIYVQAGIVAVPLSFYFGSLGNEAARTSVVLTRPGRPYKITKVESDTEFIKATVEPYRADTEYKIVATYTGKAPLGRFFARIKVHTDDPKQPVIELVAEGTVK